MNLDHLPIAVLRNIVRNYDRNGYRPGSPFWAMEADVRAALKERELNERETQESEAVKITDTFPAVRDD